jgi:hypothetical protein
MNTERFVQFFSGLLFAAALLAITQRIADILNGTH